MWWPRRRVYVDNLPKPHDGRFLLLFFVMFIAALGGVYAVGYVAAGDKVPARTTVAGVDVGSMTRQQAHHVLVDAFASRLREPLRITVAGQSVKLVPQEVGLSFDVEATLDDAMGGTDWNPQHMLKVVEGGGAVDPIFRADPVALGAALKPLADRVERPPVDASVAVKAGKAVVSAGHPGRRLDVGVAAEKVVAALRNDQTSATVPLTIVAPAVDEATATAFVHDRLGPALSHPAVVAVGDTSLKVLPAQFGPALDVVEADGGFRLGILPGALWARTHALVNSMPGRPVDARVVFKNGRPSVVPGRPGTEVSAASWAKAVFAATQTATHRSTAAVTTVQPAVTTADARALSITTKIAAASAKARTRLAGALSLAARNLDATVVLPGDSFSYDRAVGSASVATVLGPLGTSTQAAAERAHMTITRWPAVSPVGHDLQFRNATDHPVYVHSWVAPPRAGRAVVFVQFWGTPRS
jgi:Putative peptidoglycan binding domain